MNDAINQRMGTREWALLAALSVLWGGSFLFVGIAVREVPPLTLVAARVAVALAVLWGIVRLTGDAVPRRRGAWAAFFGMAILNNVVPFSLVAWGQTHIASSLASILNATTPLFGVVVAHWLTPDERMTGRRLAGVAIGFVGVAVMIGPAALTALGVDVAAQFAVLGAAVSYAFAGVFGRRFKAMGIAPMATATGQVAAATMMLVPLALVVDRPWTLPSPSSEAAAAVLGLAFVSTALAYAIFFRLLASAGAVNIMLVTLLIPVSAILFGATILGEHLAPRHFAGMALIAAGLACLDGRPLEAVRRRRRPVRA